MMDASQKQDLRFSRLLKLPMYLWSIVFVFVALLYVIGLSFLSRGEIMGVTGEVTLSNYARLASPDYVKVLLQSLKLAALTTAICIVVGYPFGYLMARLSPVARSVVMLLIIVPFWTNALIRIYGWRILLMGNGPINTVLMNLGLIQEPLKLLYTDGAVLLGMVYALIPFMILPTFTTERAFINLDASAMAIWHAKIKNYPLTFRYQVNVPVVGAMFSPHYGQSYYEIFTLGNSDGVIQFTSLHNQPSVRQMLSIDFPVRYAKLRFSYMADLQQSDVNNIKTHTYSHVFMVGFVKDLYLIRNKNGTPLPAAVRAY